MSPDQEAQFVAETRSAIRDLNAKVDHVSAELSRMRTDFMEETREFMVGARSYRQALERRLESLDEKLSANTEITADVRDLVRGLKIFGRFAKWTGGIAAAYIAVREFLRMHGLWR